MPRGREIGFDFYVPPFGGVRRKKSKRLNAREERERSSGKERLIKATSHEPGRILKNSAQMLDKM